MRFKCGRYNTSHLLLHVRPTVTATANLESGGGDSNVTSGQHRASFCAVEQHPRWTKSPPGNAGHNHTTLLGRTAEQVVVCLRSETTLQFIGSVTVRCVAFSSRLLVFAHRRLPLGLLFRLFLFLVRPSFFAVTCSLSSSVYTA